MKTVGYIFAIVIVLVILYFLYKYLFVKKADSISEERLIADPCSIYSGLRYRVCRGTSVLPSGLIAPIINVNQTEYDYLLDADKAYENLTKTLNIIGYYTARSTQIGTTLAQGDESMRADGDYNHNIYGLVKVFAAKFPATAATQNVLNVNTYLIDGAKWAEYTTKVPITFWYKRSDKAYNLSLLNTITNFFGKSFINLK